MVAAAMATNSAHGVYIPALDLRLWSGGDNSDAGNELWTGGGECVVSGESSDISRDSTAEVSIITAGNPALRDFAHSDEIKGARVEISRWFLEDGGWQRRPRDFFGVVSAASEEGGVLNIEVSSLRFRQKPLSRRWDHADQQLRYPGDRGFEEASYTEDVQRIFNWPPSAESVQQRRRALLAPGAPTTPEFDSANAPPVIVNPGNKVYVAGRTIAKFPIRVNDPLNRDYTVRVTGLPTGLSYRANDYYSWTAPAQSRNGNGGRRWDIDIGSGTWPRSWFVDSTQDHQHRISLMRELASGVVALRRGRIGADTNIALTEATMARMVFQLTSGTNTVTFRGPGYVGNPSAAVDLGGRIVWNVNNESEVKAFSQAIAAGDSVTVTAWLDGDPGVVTGAIPADADTTLSTVGIVATVGGEVVRDDFDIRIATRGTSQPPRITPIPNKEYTRGITIQSFPVLVRDENPTTVTVTGLPDGLTYDSATSRVSGTPAISLAPGDHTVRVTANDGVYQDVWTEFTIRISAAAGTLITVPGSATVRAGSSITPQNLSISAVDGSGASQQVVVEGLPPGVQYRATDGRLIGVAQLDATVIRTASDGIAKDVLNRQYTVSASVRGTTATAQFTIGVLYADDTTDPLGKIPSRTPVTVMRGSAISNISFVTPNAVGYYKAGGQVTRINATQSIAVSGLPSGLTATTVNVRTQDNRIETTTTISGTVSATARQGDYPVTITATPLLVNAPREYPASSTQFVIRVTAAAANQPPLITMPGNMIGERGEALIAVTLGFSDAESDSITERVTGLPSGIVYSSATKMITGTLPSDASLARSTITVTATATGGTTTNTLTFTVLSQAANRPPSFVSPGTQNWYQGETVDLRLDVEDPDNDRVAIRVTGLPQGLTFSETTRRITGVVSITAPASSHTIQVFIDDRVNAQVTRSFQANVVSSEATRPMRVTPLLRTPTRTVTLPPMMIQQNRGLSGSKTLGNPKWDTKRVFSVGASITSSDETVISAARQDDGTILLTAHGDATQQETITIVDGGVTYTQPVWSAYSNPRRSYSYEVEVGKTVGESSTSWFRATGFISAFRGAGDVATGFFTPGRVSKGSVAFTGLRIGEDFYSTPAGGFFVTVVPAT